MRTSSQPAATCSHTPAPRLARAVNGVRFDAVTRRDLASTIDRFLDCGESHVVHFFAAHPTVLAREDATYRATLNKGDLNLADGLPVAWALRMLGQPADRITGTQAFLALCDWGIARGVRHFFYGGTPEVLTRMRANLEQACPGIEIAGAISPPFKELTDDDLDAAASEIRASGADLVWVGLGAPKQDVVGEKLRERRCASTVLCVGAAFDFVAGVKRRAPRWMQATGLEWAFRLGTEPRRLWRRYLIGNPQFVAGVARDFAAARLPFASQLEPAP